MILSWGFVCLFGDVKISIFRINWKTEIGPGSGVAIRSEQLNPILVGGGGKNAPPLKRYLTLTGRQIFLEQALELIFFAKVWK